MEGGEKVSGGKGGSVERMHVEAEREVVPHLKPPKFAACTLVSNRD